MHLHLVLDDNLTLDLNNKVVFIDRYNHVSNLNGDEVNKVPWCDMSFYDFFQPRTEDYRNKCEFTVGLSEEGKGELFIQRELGMS